MAKTKLKIAVAMSGGVDSSVAAALLKEQGHEVIGLTMQLWPQDEGNHGGREAIDSARQVAFHLGIPHHVIDFRDMFARVIIDDFCREYGLGRTPNPCVLCNKYIKFGTLWEKAVELGADFIATGHYARLEHNGAGIILKKGADAKKDQSYFLCRVSREQLSHVVFPVGHLTKTGVRQMAKEMKIPTASRPESQEICFIPDNDYAGFLKNYLSQAAIPGPILDGRGNVLGEHRGIMTYTIGQRHGLGLAAAEPLYVTSILADRNAIVVGAKVETYSDELIAGDLNWISGGMPDRPVNLKAKVRYRHPEAPVTVVPLDDNHVYVKFTAPQLAITPGQTVAFSDGDTIIGGGTIIRQGR